MSYKKLSKEFTPEELAESFIFTKKISPKSQKAADRQLAEARRRAQETMTDSDRLTSRIMSLKFQIEHYIKADESAIECSFGYFLKDYIGILDRKRRAFAAEIGIDESMLSQMINQHRTPPDYIAIRLELHSNNSLPAEYWFKLIEQDRQREIRKKKSAMIKKQRKYVTGNINK